MPGRIPLYREVNSKISEFQPGDTLNPDYVDVTDVMTLDSGEALSVNDAVYIDSNGKASKAKADALSTMGFFGFTLDAAAGADLPVRIKTSGIVTGFSGLGGGQTMYVSTSVVGGLQNSEPSSSGEVVQVVGVVKAGTTDSIIIDKSEPIRLG